MTLVRLTITLKEFYAGKDIELNHLKFVKGVHEQVTTEKEATGLATYFGKSYNCDVDCRQFDPKAEKENPILEDVLDSIKPTVVEPEVKPTVDEDDEPPEYEVPSTREASILSAIQSIDESNWVEDVVPHPPVADVIEAASDSSITKEEITDAIENWLVDDAEE